jgi:uncharacterized surface protein with fasciclin (FAS1) repeats
MTRSTRTRIAGAALGLGALIAAGCGDNDVQNVTEDTAADVIESADTIVGDVVDQADQATADLASTLRENGLDSVATLVERVDLGAITGGNDFTFFAPNNEAFTAITSDEAADLLSNPTRVADVLRNHLLGEIVMSDELSEMSQIQPRSGQSFAVTTTGGDVSIGDATVVRADIEAAGGVIHIVDRVLLP